MQQSFDLETLVDTAISARLDGVFTAMPGIITSYDASKQSATVQPAVWAAYENEQGDRVPERLPVVQAVPVVFPGAGGFRITFPVAKGDTCLLVFTNCSMDRWLATGGEQDPGDDRRHSIGDAVCIVGLRNFANPLSSAPTTTMSMGQDGGPTIEITGSEIHAGGTEPLVLRSEFLAHTHATAALGAPSPPITGAAGSSLTFPGTSVLKGG